MASGRLLAAALILQTLGASLAVRMHSPDGDGDASGFSMPKWVEELSASVTAPCTVKYKLRDLVEGAKTWCDPKLVPEEKRAPKKLQGLFWLKGLPLPDFAACLSTGIWDQATRSLSISVWRDFVFAEVHSFPYALGFHYNITFKDDTLTEADIKPYSEGNYYQKLFGTVPLQVFAQVAEFPLIEHPGSNGEKWSRPSYFGTGSAQKFTNEYNMWRVMDGNKNVNAANTEMMYRIVGKMHDGDETEAFHQYDEPCNL